MNNETMNNEQKRLNILNVIHNPGAIMTYFVSFVVSFVLFVFSIDQSLDLQPGSAEV